jgi:acyl-CoA synthetase (AMP-forming)/AMP-acid ligase II
VEEATILGLLASADAQAIALESPGAAPLTFGALRALMRDVREDLNSRGVGQGDRVALALPNSVEMAAAFLAIASAAAAAPLNPAYTVEEFRFYLEDLEARVLVTETDLCPRARAAALDLGIPILTLTPRPERGSGWFGLDGGAPAPAARPGEAAPSDLALLLHTSGTTARPKLTPLFHGNIAASARNVAASLALSPEDRGVSLMPLFHIHGLIAGLLAPLAAGGRVFCARGVTGMTIYPAIDAARATWLTAVPTLYHFLILLAEDHADIIARHPLRFLRSSSAAISPALIAQLEARFSAPVIEAYGMTEASHQMASNPLHGARKPGSVGPSAGAEIAVIDAQDRFLPAGEIGEVVVRGPTIMRGYEKNAQANAESFVGDWFRTGDQGRIDADGYLWLTGRLKEIINQGGEKISPREVDIAAAEHPAVLQAVTFAAPHEELGEEVALAVVLRDGASASAIELQDFLAQRLAPFKIPARIVFLSQIPTGPTGKPRRVGMAKALGLT